ncbi:substrate-binding domain-containing protein [Methylobacterium radiodurans]|uniref:LuxR family transcriptional regulator n=1 Tax=Methylobacterium radiodurans TaxID=2202828 RepID=A0A2U8VY74_9HYPH|nr:substrate-binding domain-containing protein [Methylobacterium radiodurans]AWN38230.1 LuxR family transcriptional regulator [Methylobacterium radiodurans]
MKPSAEEPAIRVALSLGGTLNLGPATLDVSGLVIALEAIERTGTVQGLADALGLSYRTAWARLQAFETALGQPLVRKVRGHGSALTEAGQALAGALVEARASLDAVLGREARALEHRLTRLVSGTQGLLRIVGSHDPLLVEAVSERSDCELSVLGSSEAVRQLLLGQADVAGFHCGALAPATAGMPFSAIQASEGLTLRAAFKREQGLMLAPGNPMKVRSVSDLAGTRARYVNRQKGSGTRIWFDRLLEAAAIPPAAIRGYGVEEFTHQAVAAVIACGEADAGLGARAAAERLGLAFVPVGWEVYYLAASRSLGPTVLDELVADLAERASRQSGYRPGHDASAAAVP